MPPALKVNASKWGVVGLSLHDGKCWLSNDGVDPLVPPMLLGVI